MQPQAPSSSSSSSNGDRLARFARMTSGGQRQECGDDEQMLLSTERDEERDDEDVFPSSSSSSSSTSWTPVLRLFGGLALAAMVSVAIVSSYGGSQKQVSTITSLGKANNHKSKGTDDDTTDDTTDSGNAITFEKSYFGFQRVGYDALPFFGPDKSTLSYAFLEDYDAVIEPNVPMQLLYLDTVSESDSLYYTFYVYDSDANEKFTGSYYPNDPDLTDTMTMSCTPHDKLDITVKQMSKSKMVNKLKMTAVCLYVRRELRDLTEDDLSTTMDAMYTIWKYKSEEGQEMFDSENYESVSFFAGLHDFNSAWLDADHIHEGLGFLPQHMKMSNLFEQSMQAVDPSVSLFYWDFTLDHYQGLSIYDSPMFTSDTFGSIKKPANSEYQWTYKEDDIETAYIPDGRWRKINAEANPLYTGLVNGFGYMRGPWNMNPAPRITRFSTNSTELPSCLAYNNWLADSDMSSFLKTSQNAPHASTHGAIGGVFGCDTMDDLLQSGYLQSSAHQYKLCAKWGFYIKEMYRGLYLTPQTDCTTNDDVDYEETSCGFVCNEGKSDDMLDMMKNTLSFSDYVPEDMSDDGWETWRDFICTGKGWRVFVGDQLESASPSDPSFWPIHPTQERLLHAKMLAGGFDDFAWPTETSALGDWVCNHAECYDYADTSADKDYYDQCCYGHFEHDQLLNFVSGDRTESYGMTNREMLDASDPTSSSYSVPYIYSHFEWTHCEAIADTVTSLISRRRRLQLEAAEKSSVVK